MLKSNSTQQNDNILILKKNPTLYTTKYINLTKKELAFAHVLAFTTIPPYSPPFHTIPHNFLPFTTIYHYSPPYRTILHNSTLPKLSQHSSPFPSIRYHLPPFLPNSHHSIIFHHSPLFPQHLSAIFPTITNNSL